VKEGGKILVNSPRAKNAYPSLKDYDVTTVDAYGIAGQQGLVIPGGMPVINTALLGALVGMLEVVTIDDLLAVIRANTPKADKNAECAMEGYRRVTSGLIGGAPEETRHAGEAPRAVPVKKIPLHNPEKMSRCHRCQICYIVCPTLAINFEGDPIQFSINKEICTACGICIQECPRGAITWESPEALEGAEDD
jgi:ferredoxin